MQYHNAIKHSFGNWRHPVLLLVILVLAWPTVAQHAERNLEGQVVRFSEETAIHSLDGGKTWAIAEGQREDVPSWAQTWLSPETETARWSPRGVTVELPNGGSLHRTVDSDAWEAPAAEIAALPSWAQRWVGQTPTRTPVDFASAKVEPLCSSEKPVQRTKTVQVAPGLSVRSYDDGATWTMAEGKQEDLPAWVASWLEQPAEQVLPAKELVFGEALIRSVDDGKTWTQVKGEIDDLPEWVRPWVGGEYAGATEPAVAQAKETLPAGEFDLFPNPTAHTATLRFTLTRAQEVRVVLYDLQGRLLQELQAGNLTEGVHELNLDVAELPAGSYFVQFIAEDRQERIRLLRAD